LPWLRWTRVNRSRWPVIPGETMTASSANVELRSPSRLEEALELIGAGSWQALAGGTDVYPAHVGRALARPLLDLGRLDELRGVKRLVLNDGSSWLRVGALETWTALRRVDLPAGCEALRQAAAEIGGRQVQNQGTLGGNLCNASPAADGVPVLMALDAQVELRSVRGRRRLPVADFVLGNRKTALAPDELLTAIEIPLVSAQARSAFLKLGHRRFLVISIAMVAVAVDVDSDGKLKRCALAVGACSAAARRLPGLESQLVGLPATQASARAARWLADDRLGWLSPLSPIDDVRGSARYRIEAVAELIPRALAAALSGDPANPGVMR
jgi:CO/xanthine dehydrogenase FAD-binding subunit